MVNFHNKKYISIFGSFVLLLGFIYFSANVVLIPDFFRGFSFPGEENDFCQVSGKDPEKPPNFIDQKVCKNDLKKKKFIWIFMDGLAYDQLLKLYERDKYQIPNLYKISTQHYRQSGSLHETYLTGKFSRNFPANEIKIDYIFRQAAKAGFPMHFRGTNFPMYFLLGENESKVVEKLELRSSENYPLDTMCEWSTFINTRDDIYSADINNSDGDLVISKEKFYEHLDKIHPNEIDINKITKCLSEVGIYNDTNRSQSKNYIFYTMKIDHFNHSFYRFSSYTMRHIWSIEISILSLMKWIDEHPEYALILSSDHGGQLYNGEDNICNHGCMTPGNEAILSIYTKELKEIEAGKKMSHPEFGDIEDIAPTVAQILEDVNIPLETRGFPLFFNNNPLYNLIAMRSKDLQVRKYLETFIRLHGENNSKLHAILDEIVNSKFSQTINDIKTESDIPVKISDIEAFLNEYKTFLSNKQVLIESLVKTMSRSLIGKIILYLLFIFLFFRLYRTYTYICDKNSKSVINKKELIIGLYIVLFCLFIDFFVSLLKPKVLADAFIYSHMVFNFIVLIAVYVVGSQSFLSKEEQILINNMTDAKKHQSNFIYGLIIMAIGVNVTYYFDLFHVLKLTFATFDSGKTLDYLNYPIFCIYLLFEFRKFKVYYFDSKYRIRLDVILMLICIFLIPMMIYFDYHLPKHFVTQTQYMKHLVRKVYMVILLLVLLSLNNYYKRPKEEERDRGMPIPTSPSINSNTNIEESQKRKKMAVALIKLPLIIFINFESDEAERLYMYAVILPMFYFLSYYYKKLYKGNNLINLLCGVCLITLPDIIYTLNQGSFSFDVSLKVTSKSIGDYADQTPIFTGFLMGTHKLRLFILTAGFILENMKFSPSSIKIRSYNLVLLLEMQITAIVISYFFYLYQDYEELYLNIFMWAGTKCIIVLLVNMALVVNFFMNTRKKDKVKDEPVPQDDTDILVNSRTR